MAFSLSPGVTISEVDLTTIVPSVPSSIGGYLGNFNWGPINEIVNISDEQQLVDRFGKPDANTFVDFFTAANFLSYASSLKLIRVGNTGLFRNAGNGAGILVGNDLDFQSNYSNINVSAANTVGPFIARFPGELGNSLLYSMCDANNTVYSSWKWRGYFSSVPGTSKYLTKLRTALPTTVPANDEVHVIVVDVDGKFSGTPNTVLERYEYLSRMPEAKKEDGTSLHYGTVINQQSKYLRYVSQPRTTQLSAANNNPSTLQYDLYFANGNVAFAISNTSLEVRMSGGNTAPITSNVVSALDYFKNADEVDVNLLMTGAHGEALIEAAINLAEDRKDCMVFFSPPSANVVNNFGNEATAIINYRNLISPSSSYAVMDSGWKYQYDKYNDTYRWIPLNADIAGLCARTDREKDAWFSPGGLNRGFIKNIVKLSFNPNKTDRDNLYLKQINPVVTFAGQGTVLFGDKTLFDRPSAFDRINVRRLFIVLEKSIARAAKYSLFEFNDSFTRAAFVNLVEPYLRDIQGRRGIIDFRVVCDETNNTGEVIDRNEFVGDIYIKPARSINFIQLNFVATRSGVDFQEIVGRF